MRNCTTPKQPLAASTTTAPLTSSVTVFQPKTATPWTIFAETARTLRFWRFFLLTLVLINVKMVFRHLDATLPKWLLRTYGPEAPFGLIYSINPAIIILTVPFVMALTQPFDPLNMIKLGTAIAAVSPFWVAILPNYLGAVPCTPYFSRVLLPVFIAPLHPVFLLLSIHCSYYTGAWQYNRPCAQ